MCKIVIVGATGNVGEEIFKILIEHDFPVEKIIALASRNSQGKEITYCNKTICVDCIDDYDFKDAKIAFFATDDTVARKYIPRASAAGCVVIDNSAYFRMHEQVPLVIPEVNEADIAMYKNKGIVANPNCSTIQMLVALKPLHDIAKIKRIVVSTYQAVSGAGKQAVNTLRLQIKQPQHKTSSQDIAFNCIPQIGEFTAEKSTREEWKMSVETSKILHTEIAVSATCVRIPVFLGHSEAINVEFFNPMAYERAVTALRKANGVTLLIHDYVTPLDIKHQDSVYVSRLRVDKSVKHGLNMWVVADNLRKGGALNAVQIAEILLRDYL